MDNPTCESCRFFSSSNNPPHFTGRCQRNAPVGSDWPIVQAKDDWCGQYEESQDAQPQSLDVGQVYLLDGEQFLLIGCRKEDTQLPFQFKRRDCFAHFEKTA